MPSIDPAVIAAAQAAAAKWRVPASVSIAQYGIESGWGAKCPGCNPFGIKRLAGYPCQQFLTHEVVDGKRISEVQTFAKFATIDIAFLVHAKLIATRPQFAEAMAALPDLEKFVGLMAAHYATDPAYAHTIMAVINGDDLRKYDL